MVDEVTMEKMLRPKKYGYIGVTCAGVVTEYLPEVLLQEATDGKQ